MTIKSLFTNISKWNSGLLSIHDKEGLSLLWLWLDSVCCFFLYGCTIRQYSIGGFYRYRAFERRRVLTFRKLFKLIKATNNPSAIEFLENKEKFNSLFSAFITRKWYTSKELTTEKFNEMCELKYGFIIKPKDGMEGAGITRVSCRDVQDPSFRISLFSKIKSSDSLIEELVIQHPEMVFGNQSVNTIRVMSLMDRNGNVTVVKALLRAGVGDCFVDNFHQGGCVYEVDISSGRVSSLGLSITQKNILFHPGTRICMLGYAIPNWDIVIDSCLSAHKLLPKCRYISWDVAITSSGIELIEGNHNGDYDMFEFVGSNQYWPRLKAFL